MNISDDRVRLIAERVARRVAGSNAPTSNTGEHQNGFDQPELGLTNESRQPSETPRARVIDFVAAGPPIRTQSRVVQTESEPPSDYALESPAPESILTASPWHGRLPMMLGHNPQSAVPNPTPANHFSEERFGVEEATVAELVEFFENEKKCSMDPSGKPCDHCAMCSSRGF